MASELLKQLKSPCTILLETYPNQNGPTNSARESFLEMSEEKSEFRKGTLDMLIPKIAAPDSRVRDGAEDSANLARLLSASARLTLPRLSPPGTSRKAEWKATDTGPEAGFYTLTRKQLDAEVTDWEQLTDAVALILGTAE